ncbi:MAG: alpha-xylosidase, partial [Candidatus Bathyarchaeota archaeon]|nr:alpha-xylosidase [Candidatus Bathyarchaeota archaeon]
MLLSLCFQFWSHDIGGFEQTASADVYKRWCAFGLLSSHSRLHGSSSCRVPWLYDEEAVDVLHFFTKLKCRLMPYMFGAACEAHELGVPVMRAMMLEFPDDPACDYLDHQYMLGDSLLVAPVFSHNRKVDYYLPEGQWTNFITGQVTEGGRWVHETYDYMSLPLMVKQNTIFPVGANEKQPNYDFGDGVTFHIFGPQDDTTTSARVPTIKGEEVMTVKASRKGQQVRVQVQGEPKFWSVLLRGVGSVQSVEGGIAKADTLGTLLVPKKGASSL